MRFRLTHPVTRGFRVWSPKSWIATCPHQRNFMLTLWNSQGLMLTYTKSHKQMYLRYLYSWHIYKLMQNLTISVQPTCMEKGYHIILYSAWQRSIKRHFILVQANHTSFSWITAIFHTIFIFIIMFLYIVVEDIFPNGQFNNRRGTQMALIQII